VTTVFILTPFNLNGEQMSPSKRLTALPIRIGRNDLNDFVLNHAAVSSFHARIEDIDGRLCITDLGSKNGTRLGGNLGGVPQPLVAHQARDMQPSGFEFFLGVHVRVQIAFDETRAPLEHRGPESFTGQVLGNAGVLFEGGSIPPPPPQFPPAQAVAPVAPPPVFAPVAPPQAMPPFGAASQIASPFLGASLAPPPPAPGEARAATIALGGLTAELMALTGLRELAASLVPGIPLETTGDIARFVTKLHDAIEVFCRSFIPLREGHSQFMSSFDLQRSMRRTQRRSPAYLAVEEARTPEALAAALLNPKDRAFDGPQALEGILADLMLHQLALLEGVMRGVRALLEELSPENVENQAGGHAMLGKHRALWNKYRELFENVSEERQAFALIFGPEFTAAYRHYRSGGQGS
jgi:type VI secretion system protein ImpI